MRRRTKLLVALLFFGILVSSTLALSFFHGIPLDLRVQELLVDDLNKNKQDLGANPLNGSAYDYSYAPQNSMGIKSWKDVNFTFWKAWLKKYFYYELEARQNNESAWQNANELLNVSLLFNETTKDCKVTLTLNTTNAPMSLFYRFTLVANRSVISHVNKSNNYTYVLNLSANQTENYSLTYNYSDLAPYIQSGVINIKQGIYNNYFYQRIKTNKKIAVNKTVVIDPTFGGDITAPTQASMDGRMWYLNCSVAQAGNIVIDNMTFAYQSNAVHDMRVGIYNDTGVFQAQSVEFQTIGDGVKYTTTVNMDDTYTIPGTGTYHLVLTSEDNAVFNYCFRNAAGSLQIDYVSHVYNQGDDLPDPEPAHGAWWDTSADLAIYATYHNDTGNTAPVNSNPVPSDTASGISLNPTLNITVNDTDSSLMNQSFWTNASGTWTQIYWNNNTANATLSNATTGIFTEFCTKYWWSSNTSDGEDWDNDTYSFTTLNSNAVLFSNEEPTNGSSWEEISLTWNLTITSPDGVTFDWNISCSSGDTNNASNDSNGSKTLSLSGLTYCTNYTIWVNATNNCSQDTNATYWFVTRDSANVTLSNEEPTNGSSWEEIAFTWNVTINSPDGVTFDWNISCSNGQSNTGTGDTNGSKTLVLSGLSYCTNYTIFVNVSNGCSNFTNATYWFVTRDSANVTLSNENPSNGSTGQPLSLDWNVTINSPDGVVFDWNISCSNGQTNDSAGDTNGSKILELTGLVASTNYTIWVNVSNGCSNFTNATYWFITQAGWSNTPPVQSSFTVNSTGNNSVNVIRWPQLNITTSDADGNTTNIYWSANGSALYQVNLTSPNGTYRDINFSFASAYNTVYQVNISVNDSHSNVSAWYRFTTVSAPAPWSNTCPVSSGEDPTNKSTGVSLTVGYWNVTINDTDGNTTTGNITCSNGNWSNWTAQANGTRSCNLSTLSYSTNYTVWLNFTDGHCTVNETYWFITVGNNCPVLTSPTPANNSVGNSNLTAFWNITINDPDGDTFNWSIEVNNSDTNSSTGDTNGTKTCNLTTPLGFGLTYTVWVNYTDGNCSDVEVFYFTIEDEPGAFNVTIIYPSNNSNIYSPQPTVFFNISHPSGNVMNWSIYVGDNYNYLLASGTNDTNGTYVHVNFHNVTEFYTDYNYSINVSDGTDWINISCTFQAILQGAGQSTNLGSVMALAAGAFGVAILAFMYAIRRRKKR